MWYNEIVVEDKIADRIVNLLQNPDYAKGIGKKGKESVRRKFIITRLFLDYLDMFRELDEAK